MTPTRSVRFVRLRGPREESIRRAVTLLEDALRTASVPGLAGSRRRVLFVRRLDLGAIQITAGPTALSLAIERELARIGPVVDAEDEAAESASAVGFADEVEPFVALALRLAAGRKVDAWFWPLAVRGFSPSTPRRDAIRSLMLTLAAGELGDAALSVLLDRARRLGLIDSLLQTLLPHDGETLLESVGWSPRLTTNSEHTSIEPSSPSVLLRDSIASDWISIATRWARVWGFDAPLLVWLVRAVFVLDRPALRLDPAFPANVVRWVRSLANAAERTLAPDHPAAIDQPISRFSRSLEPSESSAIIRPTKTETPSRPRGIEPADAFAEPSFLDTDSEFSDHLIGATDESAPREELPAYVPFSDDAGFFFLIPLLTGLGVSDWLAENLAMIEWDFPRRFLAHAANRLDLAAEDPARAVFDTLLGTTDREPMGWSVPFAGRIGRAFSEQRVTRPSLTPSSLRGWFLWCRRACLRWTGIPLREVVRRRGSISVTRTHIDLTFPFREADARIRRAGIDLDPGWVPWLGRVVLFHYE